MTATSPSMGGFFSTIPKTNPKSPVVMKPIIPFALLGAFFAVGAAKAASTTPVGYITVPIEGNTSASASGAYTLVAASLVKPVTFAGATSSAPSGSSFVFASGVPTDLDGTYLLEIASGPNEGWWTTVVSSTATGITVADAVPAGLLSGTQVSVRKFSTVADVFGANSLGLTTGDQADFDFIEILNPVDQSTKAVIYFGGWLDLASEAPADSEIIYPGSAVRIVRMRSTPLSLVISGEVKTTKTQVDLFESETWVGQNSAIGASFGELGLGSTILSTDEVVLYGADGGSGQAAVSYVAFGGEMLDLGSEAPSNGVVVGEGSGFLLKRPAGSPSTITFPAQPIGQ